MAIAPVAAGSSSGSGTTLAITGVTCAAGNVLVIDTLAVNTGNTPISVLSVTDNTTPPPANSYVIPAPANAGAFFSGQNQYANTATIWCEVAQALSGATVTVTFTTSAGFSSAEWQTYSGAGSGLVTVDAAAQSLLTTASSAATPPVTAGAGDLIIAVANINGAASSASNSYTLRPDNMSAWLGTTSAGPTSTTFTLTASSPVWGTTIVAIGPAAGGAGQAQPGQAWLRRFRRRQYLPQPFIAAAPVAAVAAPVQRPQIISRPRSRARLGPQGLCAAGLAVAAALTAQAATPARQPPPVPHRPPPARAHVGPAGRSADGIASAIVTPLGGPARPRPQIPRRQPARALWRGYASRIVTPLGAPGPSWRPQPRRPAPARAGWHGNAGPAAIAPPAPQAYQRPPGQARSPAPRRGQWHGNAGPASAAPSAAAVPRPLTPPRARPPRRAVWRGGASQVITPLGTPAARPALRITSRPRVRVLWHGGAGPQPSAAVTVVPAPRRIPQPSRRKPGRAVWRYIRGLVNAPPPPAPTGVLTATTAPGSALTAADASAAALTAGTGSSALTAATATQGTLTAGTQSTGGPS